MAAVNARSLAEALDLLDKGYQAAAGCTNLLVDWRAGEVPHDLVSLSELAELKSFEETNGFLTLGAGLTFSEIEEKLAGSPAHASCFNALRMAAARIGSRQIRNRATLGGNMADASPAADSLPALAAFDGDVELVSVRGTRRLPVTRLMIDAGKTALAPGELIRAVHLPVRGWRSFFYKASPGRGASISTVSLAFAVLETEGCIEDVRLAFGSLAPTVVRAHQCEAFLLGKNLTAETMKRAADYLDPALSPISDVRGSARYRRMTARQIVRHAAELLDTWGRVPSC